MKVLFCSPYLNSEDIIKGGVNSWGNYIFSFQQTLSDSGVELIPVSFDRKKREVAEVNEASWQRLYSGVKEVGASFVNAVSCIKNEKPDVMHLCTSASVGLVKDLMLLRVAKRYGVKSVLHLHFGRTNELWQKNNWEWKLLQMAINLTDVVVSMDKNTFTTLKNTVTSKKIYYLPNPLPLTITEQIEAFKSNINRVPNQLLFVGHSLRTKGVYELVEGCCDVEKTTLRIIGKSSPEIRDELENIANKRDDGKWLTFVGEIPHSEVLKEFLAADVFVFPSYTEGFPNVILEAMACECTIASSNVGAIPEMLNVEGEACGICFEPRDSRNVTKAVQQILSDKSMKMLMSKRAKERVNKMYSIPKVWEQLVEIWKS